jgi:hypothetical protein
MENVEAGRPGTAESIDLSKLRRDHYPNIALTRFLNVDYVHAKTSDGGDIYVTRHGLPFIGHMEPENWYITKWFKSHREKLAGTSTVYKVKTKPVDGTSLDMVVKWCRMGQDVPLETKIIEDVLRAEFNSPFEEFSLVEELRANSYGPSGLKIMLQKPLAVYVPPERLQLWQTGRSKAKIMSKIAKHPGIEIDILRQYILIYKWVRGLNAVAAFDQAGLPGAQLSAFTQQVINDLRLKGYRVLDQKPAHFIMRPRPDGSLLKRRDSRIPYALVDFELLERMPEHEEQVKASRRGSYLVKQRDRFRDDVPKKWPRHLQPMTIMGADYVYGLTESTNGHLWVAGHDPDLFDYFQPERWRKTPRTRLSPTDDVFYTKTKDNINIVWKVSKVGELAETAADPGARIQECGYNSPFEEFSLAFDLTRRGVATIYPRAIYKTGLTADTGCIADRRRYESHTGILTPEGVPVLQMDHDYITVWGFWNGPDESLAEHDGVFYTGISAANALRREIITGREYDRLMQRLRRLLAENGMENMGLKGNHVLLSLNPRGELMRDREGELDIRLCNFETMQRIA